MCPASFFLPGLSGFLPELFIPEGINNVVALFGLRTSDFGLQTRLSLA
jgi:hypothetical protein